jgi:hypothetical protein
MVAGPVGFGAKNATKPILYVLSAAHLISHVTTRMKNQSGWMAA